MTMIMIHLNEVSNCVGELDPKDLSGGRGHNPRRKRICFLFAPASTAGCVRRFLFDDRKFFHTDRRKKIEQSCAVLNSRIIFSQWSWNPLILISAELVDVFVHAFGTTS